MQAKLIIRTAHAADSPAVAQLIGSVRHYFLSDPTVAGAESFNFGISESAIADCIESPLFNYIVGEFGHELAGVAALKNDAHVHHLFVLSTFHRQGVARRLWLRLKEDAEARGNPGAFTVNSSIFAVPVYSTFGFTQTTGVQTKNGIQFQPMRRVAS
jgi:GNAT superfamily N-acetyltransferase